MNCMYKKIVWMIYVFYIFSVVAFSESTTYYIFSNLTFLLLIALMGYYLISTNPTIMKESFVFIPFVFFCFLSFIWSYSKSATFTRSITMLALIIFFIILKEYVVKTNSIKEYIWGTAISGILFIPYLIISYGVSGIKSIIFDGTRLGGEIANENTIAIMLIFSFIIFFQRFIKSKRLIYIFPMILTVSFALLTGSKKGIIDLVLGSLLIILISQNDKNVLKRSLKNTNLIIIVFLVLYILWTLPIFTLVRERIELMFYFLKDSSSIIDYSTITRQKMIKYGLEQFYKTPILGIGIGASDYITNIYMGEKSYLHNNYVELLATGGMVGFLLYYIPIWKIIKRCWINREISDEVRVCFVLLVITLVNDFAAVSYFSKYTVVILALCLASTSIKRIKF